MRRLADLPSRRPGDGRAAARPEVAWLAATRPRRGVAGPGVRRRSGRCICQHRGPPVSDASRASADPTRPRRSLPSDHATAAFAVAFAVGVFLSWRWGLLLSVLAAVIGFARVWAGVHNPADILVGAVIGGELS
ncbi:phosphatase PAP2 family protein [Micromonospora sp. M12]